MLEKARIRQPKTIDTLLHVADNKAVVITRDLPQDALLKPIRILIFIHHDRCIVCTKLLCDIRRINGIQIILQLLWMPTQECQCTMLQITEVQKRTFQFLLLKGMMKIQCQTGILANGGIRSILRGTELLCCGGQLIDSGVPCLVNVRYLFFQRTAKLWIIVLDGLVRDAFPLFLCSSRIHTKAFPCLIFCAAYEELQPALQFLIEIQIMMDDCHVFLSCRVQFRIPLHQNVHCAVVSGT